MSAVTPHNPTKLSSRFEIRKLTSEHVMWAAAIIIHSNVHYSPIWSVVYPENKADRCYKGLSATTYLIEHQIDSGLSYGVFDTQYKFKRPESAITGGKLYWDEKDLSVTKEQLLEQMDFPLVSIAMSYDGAN